jgi:DNA mismatch repair endonuclease MutH
MKDWDMRDPSGFDYLVADADEIEAVAKSLVGKPLIELQPALAPMVPSSAKTKGTVGRIYEACFDIPANSRPGADFPRAGIELKSVPILLSGGEAKAKERVSISMINFATLAGQSWESAEVRKKLAHMLMIFYGWEPLQPIARFRTLAAGIWKPDESTLKTIQADWQTVRDLVASGRREEVSESLTSILGAATKGPGHGSRSRAWSLKQPFVSWLYMEMAGKEPVPAPSAARDPASEFERSVLDLLTPHVGRRFDALARLVGREDKGGKAAVANIVRALVGQRSKGSSGNFDRFGVEVKSVPVSPGGRVVEAMSFPAFIHEELVYETWEDSDLLGRLNRLLIVPVHRGERVVLDEVRLGRPFFWSPAEAELEGIRLEWERFRRLVEAGEARRLPVASETRFIHVRPKGRNATDRDQAPGGFDVIKKAFWLNQPYLEQVLERHGALTPPTPR